MFSEVQVHVLGSARAQRWAPLHSSSLSNSSPHTYARSLALTCDVQLGVLTSGLGGSVLGQPPPWPGSRPPAPRGSRH